MKKCLNCIYLINGSKKSFCLTKREVVKNPKKKVCGEWEQKIRYY
jgi:hypothetical protein